MHALSFLMVRLEQERMMNMANGQNRADVKPGIEVYVILKKDQRTGVKTKGVVKDLLTNSQNHPHGIKVRLEDGQVGRVCEIL